MPPRNPVTPSPEPAPEAPAQQRSPDEWAKLKAACPLLLAGAKYHNRWVQGDQITEQAFDAGYSAFASLPVGR